MKETFVCLGSNRPGRWSWVENSPVQRFLMYVSFLHRDVNNGRQTLWGQKIISNIWDKMELLDDFFKGTFLFIEVMMHYEAGCIIYMTFYQSMQDFKDTDTSGWPFRPRWLWCCASYSVLFLQIWVGCFFTRSPLFSFPSPSSLFFCYCPLLEWWCHQYPSTQGPLAYKIIPEA